MDYKGQYIYPPRPSGAVPPDSALFKQLEQDPDWFAQAKLNGSNTQLVVTDTGDVRWFNRHKQKSHFNPLATQVSFFKKLKKVAPIVLNLECMQNKVTTMRHQLYVFDILVFKGQWLLGSTTEQRQILLRELFPERVPTLYRFAHEIGPMTWLAQNFPSGWEELIETYKDYDFFEGLVLKKRSGLLEPGFAEKNNTGWSLRSRLRDL